MAAYYNIASTFNTFANCPAAVNYLADVIERESPDVFHWSDWEEALMLTITGKSFTPAVREDEDCCCL